MQNTKVGGKLLLIDFIIITYPVIHFDICV